MLTGLLLSRAICTAWDSVRTGASPAASSANARSPIMIAAVANKHMSVLIDRRRLIV